MSSCIEAAERKQRVIDYLKEENRLLKEKLGVNLSTLYPSQRKWIVPMGYDKRRAVLLVTSLLTVFLSFFGLTRFAGGREPDVHYQPTTPEVAIAMLELAEVSKSDIVYDLGSGDGRIVIEAARRFGARGVGVDIDPERIREGRENAAAAKVTDRVVFREEDLFTTDFREATVVTLFLWPDLNLKLRPRLLAELAPGTRIVSNRHPMGDWLPERTIHLGERPLYLWRIPAR